MEDSETQGSLACYSPWGRKELDTTQQLNNNKVHKLPADAILLPADLSVKILKYSKLHSVDAKGN